MWRMPAMNLDQFLRILGNLSRVLLHVLMHVSILQIHTAITDTDTEYDVITSRKLLMNFGQFCKKIYERTKMTL